MADRFWKANAAKSALALVREGSVVGGNRGRKCLIGLCRSACKHGMHNTCKRTDHALSNPDLGQGAECGCNRAMQESPSLLDWLLGESKAPNGNSTFNIKHMEMHGGLQAAAMWLEARRI